MKRISLILLFAAFFAAYAQSDPVPVPSVTLLPSGTLSGNPGSVVGWGFTVTYNATADWAVLTASDFTGSPLYGSYVDYLSLPGAPLYVAGPTPESSTVTQPWDPSPNPPLGVGEFDIYSTDPSSGINITGNIVIHYALFSQDPNDPAFDPSSVVPGYEDATLTEPVRVSVTPEPASLLLMSIALLPFALIMWSRRRALPF